MKIMVVDDEAIVLRTMQRLFNRNGYGKCILCDNGGDALKYMDVEVPDIVLLDLLMPGMNGLSVLEQAKPLHPHTEFIVITALDEVTQAVKAVRLGAYDYLVKPLDQQRLLLTIERAYERMSMRLGLHANSSKEVPEAFEHVLTVSSRMREQLAYAAALARGGPPVLISGASGTGKELVAKGIHAAGSRASGPFVAVNVSAVPESLFESQFFGHQKGAFTGAGGDHQGLFQQANGGTLFLDEVGELPMHLQPKLLRVLEERAVVPLGGSKPEKVDVGIISATNCDLDKACSEGKFRLDLLYRLRGGHITLPPLKDREGDIALLARHFLEKCSAELERPALELSIESLQKLEAYDFPGNVRELAQLMYNAALRSEGSKIRPSDLLLQNSPDDSSARMMCSLRDNEARHVIYVLQTVNWDKHEAAKILGVSLRQMQRKIASLKEDSHWSGLLCDT